MTIKSGDGSNGHCNNGWGDDGMTLYNGWCPSCDIMQGVGHGTGVSNMILPTPSCWALLTRLVHSCNGDNTKMCCCLVAILYSIYLYYNQVNPQQLIAVSDGSVISNTSVLAVGATHTCRQQAPLTVCCLRIEERPRLMPPRVCLRAV